MIKHFWILLVVICTGWAAETVKPRDVGVAEFEQLLKSGKHVVLDVRTPKEFAAGHLPGATNIDFYSQDFKQAIAGLDKSKTYLVYCASGRRSGKTAEQLSEMRFPSVYNLEGGFKAWEKAGKLVKKESP